MSQDSTINKIDMVSGSRCEVVVRFLNIGIIVDRDCLNFSS
jgi:hypothetical protein